MANGSLPFFSGSELLARTRLLGRAAELGMVCSLLADDGVPLVTLTGPGGVGKTQLALAVADAVADAFPDGVDVVSLAPLDDPAYVLPTIARGLGVPDAGPEPLLGRLRTLLGGQRRLLVLDNFERVTDAGPVLAELVAGCPNLNILVTSRVRLRLSMEHVFFVPPLALPSAPETLGSSTAVQLFVERARAVDPGFALASDNAAAVAAICEQLDGLPLATELAAARSGTMSPAKLLGWMDRRLPLLTSGPRDHPLRLQSLRATMDWSFELLPEPERVLFRRLGVFSGGFTLDAAAVVAGDCDERRLFDCLVALIDASLVTRRQGSQGEPRFTMLETIREYALDRLAAAGEAQDTRRRHALHLLDWVESLEPRLQSGERRLWLDLLEADHGNLRAALAWARDTPGEADTGLRIASALFWFWYIRGHLGEGRDWSEGFLDSIPEASGSAVVAKGRYTAGRLAWRHGDNPTAVARLLESVAGLRALGDQRMLALAMSFCGLALRHAGASAEALRIQEESVSLARATGDRWELGMALFCLGDTLAAVGSDDCRREAGACFAESVALFRSIGDGWGAALSLSSWGDLLRVQGDLAAARPRLEASLAALQAEGDPWRVAKVLEFLGRPAMAEGDAATAAEQFGEAAAGYRLLGHRRLTGLVLHRRAVAEARRRNLLGAALAWQEAVGEQVASDDRARLAATLRGMADLARVAHAPALAERLRAQAVLADKRTAPLDLELFEDAAALVALARTVSSHSSATTATERASMLSRRERDVLRLVAAGRTDREIAEALFVSHHTVSNHLRHILARLDVANRAAAVAAAEQAGWL